MASFPFHLWYDEDMIFLGTYASPVGELVIASQDNHVIGLWKKDQKYFLSTVKETYEIKENDSTILVVKKWLDDYFSGHKPAVDSLDLWLKGTRFQQEVWQLLLQIPYGSTESYASLAKKVALARHQKTMSAQAVGGAVSHNPLSILVPCHRVIAIDGSLTGYAGGLEMKKYLLDWERNTK